MTYDKARQALAGLRLRFGFVPEGEYSFTMHPHTFASVAREQHQRYTLLGYPVSMNTSMPVGEVVCEFRCREVVR